MRITNHYEHGSGKPATKRVWKPKVERERPALVRITYPAHWTYEEKCVADERRISNLEPR